MGILVGAALAEGLGMWGLTAASTGVGGEPLGCLSNFGANVCKLLIWAYSPEKSQRFVATKGVSDPKPGR